MKRFKQIVLIIVGSFFVFLGIIGIILPVVPTVPFLIIAGACYINSSKRLYKRLIRTKYVGPHIESYVERKEVTRNFKLYSLFFLWVPTLITEIFIVRIWYLRVIPVIIVFLVTWHILKLKTVNEEKIFKNADGKINE